MILFYIQLFQELAGSTKGQQAKVDMIVDCLEDFLKPAERYVMESDANRKVDNM